MGQACVVSVLDFLVWPGPVYVRVSGLQCYQQVLQFIFMDVHTYVSCTYLCIDRYNNNGGLRMTRSANPSVAPMQRQRQGHSNCVHNTNNVKVYCTHTYTHTHAFTWVCGQLSIRTTVQITCPRRALVVH